MGGKNFKKIKKKRPGLMDRWVSQPDRGSDEDNSDGSRGERPSGNSVPDKSHHSWPASGHSIPWDPSRGPEPGTGGQSLKCESNCCDKGMDGWTDIVGGKETRGSRDLRACCALWTD